MIEDQIKLSMHEIEAGLAHILQSPRNEGRLEMIVRRPAENEREVLEEGQLDMNQGLIGDNWMARGKGRVPDKASEAPDPETQIDIMNARVIALLARDRNRWQLAGDQLFIDLDLSDENLPPGSRIAIGEAILEVSRLPHTGCDKFSARFGSDAIRFVNSPEGRKLHLRGINTRVVKGGRIQVGDVVKKILDG